MAISRLLLSSAFEREHFAGLELFLGIPLGLGLSSVFFFLTVQVAGVPFTYGAALEILIVVALLVTWRLKAPGRFPNTGAQQASPGWLKTAFAITALSSSVSYVLFFQQMPHGGWDAFAIWNLKARFMFRLPHGWQEILPSQLGYSHLDYPFLLPATVTRAWNWLGSDTATVPAVIGALFPVSVVGLLTFSLRAVANRTAAMVGAVFLLGTPLFIAQGASQLADIPLSCYYLATSVLLWLYYRDQTPKLLPLIGCAAALGGWTKNEGNTFFLAVVAVVLVFPLRGIGRRERLRRLASLALGAAPGLIVIVVFKLLFAGPNWMVPTLGKAAVIARVTDTSRWALIFKSLADNLVRFGGWPVNPLLLVLAGLSIRKLMPGHRRALYPFFVIIMVVLVSDVSVYLIAPNLPWLLETSLDRLLLQLWPMCIFVTLAAWASTGTTPPVAREATTDAISVQVAYQPPSSGQLRTGRGARQK
jgi:hypothetical protein